MTQSPLGTNSESAIGALRSDRGDFCTVVHAGEGTLLTAAHCLEETTSPANVQIEFGEVVFSPKECAPVFRFRPKSIELHPSLDLARLTLSGKDAEKLGGSAIVLSEDPPELSTRVWIAGFGLDEAGVLGVRRFVESRVDEVTTEMLVVSSEVESGACGGDSGGPVFSSDGADWRVAGVLSRGSPSCTGRDEFVRVESPEVRGWIEANASN